MQPLKETKVYIPVDVKEASGNFIPDKSVLIVKEQYEMDKNWENLVKEQTGYFLTKQEMEELLSNVFRAGSRRGYSGYPNTDNWTQPTEIEYINKILNNE